MKTSVLFLIKRPLISNANHTFRMEYWIMLLGIIISVTVVSAALNLFEGYQRTLKQIILNSNSHIYIYSDSSPNFTAENISFVKDRLSKHSSIKSIEPVVANSVMLRIGNKVRGCMLKAYSESSSQNKWYRDYITRGNTNLANGSIIIGDRLAKELNIKIGEETVLLYPQTTIKSPIGLMPLQKTFIISGIIKTGYYEMDKSLILMTDKDAFDFYNIPQEYTYLEVTLKDKWIDKADKLTKEYSILLGNTYQLRSWVEFNGNLFALITIEKWLIFLVFSFLILIAGLNCISTVSTSILERKKEIGLLKTLGMSINQIKQVLYLRIMLICLSSIIIGLILGAGTAWLITKQTLYQLKGDVYFIDKITMHISTLNNLAVLLFAAIIVGLCIRFPLKYVQKLQIVDILRWN